MTSEWKSTEPYRTGDRGSDMGLSASTTVKCSKGANESGLNLGLVL